MAFNRFCGVGGEASWTPGCDAMRYAGEGRKSDTALCSHLRLDDAVALALSRRKPLPVPTFLLKTPRPAESKAMIDIEPGDRDYDFFVESYRRSQFQNLFSDLPVPALPGFAPVANQALPTLASCCLFALQREVSLCNSMQEQDLLLVASCVKEENGRRLLEVVKKLEKAVQRHEGRFGAMHSQATQPMHNMARFLHEHVLGTHHLRACVGLLRQGVADPGEEVNPSCREAFLKSLGQLEEKLVRLTTHAINLTNKLPESIQVKARRGPSSTRVIPPFDVIE